MKCRSVACIWPDTPPSHKVTASAALNHPPTLYTGGSDGSILWWNLSSSDSNSEIKPVAMLCGHAAPIAGLSICCPMVVTGDDTKTECSSNGDGSYGALISACTDGVLCVWSRGSGHCRRRRKLPPWVGSPCTVRTLPTSPRYVCIGCSFIDARAHLSDPHSIDSFEGGEASADKGCKHGKLSKTTVVIVDTHGLTIVQTVFHGTSSIGRLDFMDIVLLGEDGEKHSVFMADSSGRVELVPILKELKAGGDDGSGLRKSSQLEVVDWGNRLSEGGQVVSSAARGNLIALVLKTRCIFRILSSDATIGEISFVEDILCVEEHSNQSHVLGGMFLEIGDAGEMQNAQYDNFCGHFAVWNRRGSAIVYIVSYLNNVFKSETLCEIPSASCPADVRLVFSFIQLKNYLLRIQSVCNDDEEPLRWMPHVTIWSLCQNSNIHGKSSRQSKMLGEGDFLAEWISSCSLHEINSQGGRKMSITSLKSPFRKARTENNKHADDESFSFASNGRLAVSSSMVISENHLVPYAVVYGFFSGEIEIVRFNMLLGPDCHGESPNHDVESPVSRQCFSGHTGAVLCLAAHRMMGAAEGWSFSHVLVSGSTDCTIRIWDLDSGNLITVMQQHVASVRQIIFPSARTERPWGDCFLSVGEDSCVALASLETLRVERMFPGHPSYPEKVVWDGARGYIACLCRSHSGLPDTSDALYIWDVKTGARERVLWGAASHSMLDYFSKGISVNSISGSILNGNTSVSSLLLPILEDGNFSQSHLKLSEKVSPPRLMSKMKNTMDPTASQGQAMKGIFPSTPSFLQMNKHAIGCTCPFPGIAALSFDLASLMFSGQKHEPAANGGAKLKERETSNPRTHDMNFDDGYDKNGTSADTVEVHEFIRSQEEYLLRFSLSFLHLWNLDSELDKLLVTEMKLNRPENLIIASGLQGDKGSLTLTFPGLGSILELWKSSSEFCALRSLTMLSIAQQMISFSHCSSPASSALAAFYTRSLADKIPDIKPPLLQLLVSFWQDESEHVRMAARTLFHCAASRAIPIPLCDKKASANRELVRSFSEIGENEGQVSKVGGTSTNGLSSDMSPEPQATSLAAESPDKSLENQEINEAEFKILDWLESYEMQDWISCVGGTSQDAMTSHIIVAAALAMWYPSLVKPSLATLVAHPLVKLVMAMNETYSSTAAELLSEGMESTWKACINSEISRLIGDTFFQIECVGSQSAYTAGHHPPVPSSIHETLVGILLPNLAMADIPGFLTVIESQIWSTASDSPVHQVSLIILVRVMRGSPRHLSQYLDKICRWLASFYKL
ncbi:RABCONNECTIN-3B ISOFORM A [Salix viminalis]|uniref:RABCONNECTIN-3B ISOFORM A n=1 Tax=Salix viminalis TaxID=40686 RepID=A0A9Q0QBE9_SALVM|nr:RABCONNECTIN-3B ISOFORM A [Salix viminalis]